MKKQKINFQFIKDNRSQIILACVKNAKKKMQAAKLLMDDGLYSEAHALLIVALEELAKANIIKKEDFREEDVGLLANHKAKAVEVIQLSGYCYEKPVGQIDFDWARQRIPAMREDCLYTRLVPTENDQFCPDDNYWRKRAKSFYNFLEKAIQKVEK